MVKPHISSRLGKSIRVVFVLRMPFFFKHWRNFGQPLLLLFLTPSGNKRNLAWPFRNSDNLIWLGLTV